MKKNVILVVALIALMTGVLSAQTYDSESDFQVTKEGNAITITGYVGKKTVVSIPPTIQNTPVTTIGATAFKSNTTITSVTIPESVKSIVGGAFFNCTKLTSLTIGKGVTKIEMSAFNGCSNLTSVTFHGEINSGGFHDQAFGLNNPLRKAFYTPKNVSGTPGTYTKSGTTWTLSAIATQPTAAPAQSGDPESDFQVTKTATAVTITKYVGEEYSRVSIPPRIQNLPVTAIGDNAFQGKNLSGITIPDGVTSIGQAAFQQNNLESVIIPKSVTKIGALAFYANTYLTSVTFQGTITSANFVNSVNNTVNDILAPFDGDLRAKYLATGGGIGTYTRPNGTSTVWTKK